MFDGKTFLPVTGTPIRKTACISRPLADAEPVPLAVAILKAKSLTRSMQSLSHNDHQVYAKPSWSSWLQFSHGHRVRHDGVRVRYQHRELAHIPGIGRAPLGAQAAVQADVLVLHHDPAGLLQPARAEQRLLGIEPRRLAVRAPLGSVAVRDDGQTIHRAD